MIRLLGAVMTPSLMSSGASPATSCERAPIRALGVRNAQLQLRKIAVKKCLEFVQLNVGKKSLITHFGLECDFQNCGSLRWRYLLARLYPARKLGWQRV